MTDISEPDVKILENGAKHNQIREREKKKSDIQDERVENFKEAYF
jgi:hypothetical protein